MARTPKIDINIDIIKETISKFSKEENINTLIRPIDMFKYCESEFENGNFPYKLTYDFWKRKGRTGKILIDEFNEVISNSYEISSSKAYDIVNVQDVINKYGSSGDIEKLQTFLVPLEKQIRSLVKEVSDLTQKDTKNQEIINSKDEIIKSEKEKNEKLQNLLLQLFSYSSSGIALDNLLNTGSTKTKKVENALKNAFSTSDDFMNLFKDKTPVATHSDKIVSIKPNIETEDDWDL